MPYDLFISYSRRDNQQARITQLVDQIKRDFAPFAKRELVPFFDQQEINGMEDWRQKILGGLRESRLLLACLSPAYLKSEYCEWEFVEYLKYEIGHLHGFNGVAPIYFIEVPGWDSKEFEQQSATWVTELHKRQNFDLRPWHDRGEEALCEAAVQERMGKLNRQIVQIITRGERAEKSLGNVDAHNPHFIGRTANLRMLRENFVTPGHIGVVTAVNGVGGLGKTALAIEYAHAFADEYGGGRWQVRCAGKDDLRLALAELATPIGFEFTDDEKKNADLQFERTSLELKKLAEAREPYRCLLFLDNVDRPGLLDPAQVARLNGGDWLHVLATTRLGENELHGAHRDRSFLAIDELPPDDALALIESYQPDRYFRSEAERDAAREIVRLLGSFTLAVYLGQFANDVTCVAFLARLKKEGLEGLDTAASQSVVGVRHGEKRLSATLHPTLERLGVAEKLTLEFAALLPPDQVPLPWLRALVAKKFPEMQRDSEPGYSDPWKNVVRCLFSLRLIQATGVVDADGQPRVVRIHRLIQELLNVKASASEEDRHPAILSLVLERSEHLEKHWYEPGHQWEIRPMIAFTLQLLEKAQQDAPKLVKWVTQWLGLWDHSNLVESMLRSSLTLQEVNSASDPVEIAITLSNLGHILSRAARFVEAEPMLRRALAIDEAYRESSHPFIAIRLNVLALLLMETNRREEAESLLRRAIEIGEKRTDDLGGLSIYLNNLALILLDLEKFATAEPILRRALDLQEQQLGKEHPEVANVLMNLAAILRKTGRLDEAEMCANRSLAIREKCYGLNHPQIVQPLQWVAALLIERTRFLEAEKALRRALVTCQSSWGLKHPQTAYVMYQLTDVLRKTNRLCEAESLIRQALDIREKALGQEHPETLKSVQDLAEFLEVTGHFEDAVLLRQRALETQERAVGPDHPDTLRSWNNYSVSLRRQGHADLAEPIVRKVAAKTAQILGDTHPLTINRHANLVLTLIMLGKLGEARQMLAANWRLNASPHANTTPRIAFLRHLITLLDSQPDTPFLGQLKTLLTGPKLPVASDVAVPWGIGYFIEFLKPKLGEPNSEFLTALVAGMNDRAKLPDLDRFVEWRDQSPVPLDAPWP